MVKKQKFTGFKRQRFRGSYYTTYIVDNKIDSRKKWSNSRDINKRFTLTDAKDQVAAKGTLRKGLSILKLGDNNAQIESKTKRGILRQNKKREKEKGFKRVLKRKDDTTGKFKPVEPKKRHKQKPFHVRAIIIDPAGTRHIAMSGKLYDDTPIKDVNNEKARIRAIVYTKFAAARTRKDPYDVNERGELLMQGREIAKSLGIKPELDFVAFRFNRGEQRKEEIA